MRGQAREERAAVGGLAAPSRADSRSFLRRTSSSAGTRLAAEVDHFLACRQTSSMRAGPRMKTDGAESGRGRGGRAKAARSPGKLGGGRMRRRTAEGLAIIKAALGLPGGDWASTVSPGMIQRLTIHHAARGNGERGPSPPRQGGNGRVSSGCDNQTAALRTVAGASGREAAGGRARPRAPARGGRDYNAVTIPGGRRGRLLMRPGLRDESPS
ncbi:hypothetical protein THAOC_35054 [Thalassiosira oceanica]|uniref:Uncharacterized protein n=1 Tax=Thalassiosira oceanica TaxID=159749 RepID=K0RB53_THAOC|nr:hypothetical protein THAOC_35054 [Thalassiosira oceanica]|eukprot:EJK46281.1 hypothetical protein THAOC_35054 [Thalassiosira oceanica]